MDEPDKMTRTTEALAVDLAFVPCPVEPYDEIYANGIFEFNITRMSKDIAQGMAPVATVQVAVSEIWQGFSRIDESHVESVDISQPVILAEIAPGQYNLIDGNHRAEKARRLGVTTLPARILTVRQHLPFLTSKKAYDAYVEYWNGKLG